MKGARGFRLIDLSLTESLGTDAGLSLQVVATFAVTHFDPMHMIAGLQLDECSVKVELHSPEVDNLRSTMFSDHTIEMH